MTDGESGGNRIGKGHCQDRSTGLSSKCQTPTRKSARLRERSFKNEDDDEVVVNLEEECMVKNEPSGKSSGNRKRYRQNRSSGSCVNGKTQRTRPGQNAARKWDQQFQELVEFKRKHGHCNVSTASGSLGYWVRTNRSRYHGVYYDYSTPLTPEQVDRLNRLGFQWKLKRGPSGDKAAKKREKKYQELIEFKKKNGHCNVPIVSGSLGRWVSMNRMRYNGAPSQRQNPLTSDQIDQLNQLGFQWKIKIGSGRGKDRSSSLPTRTALLLSVILASVSSFALGHSDSFNLLRDVNLSLTSTDASFEEVMLTQQQQPSQIISRIDPDSSEIINWTALDDIVDSYSEVPPDQWLPPPTPKCRCNHLQYRPLYCPWYLKPFRNAFDFVVTETVKWPTSRKLLGCYDGNVSDDKDVLNGPHHTGLPMLSYFGTECCRAYANATQAYMALSDFDPCWYETEELQRCFAERHVVPLTKTNLTAAQYSALRKNGSYADLATPHL